LTAIRDLSAFFSGQPIGLNHARHAFVVLAETLVTRVGQFHWGQHLLNGPESERGCCQYCGGDIAWVLNQLECSAVA
jgi:hypothetical protein